MGTGECVCDVRHRTEESKSSVNHIRDLRMRIVAGFIVVGTFFGLGAIKRADVLGLSDFLTGGTFMATGLVLVAIFGAAWLWSTT